MPLVEVTYDIGLAEPVLRRLGELLPDIVSEAVASPEEPWVGPPEPGDIEIRFHPKGRFDVGELDCVIEVRTRLLPSRVKDKHDRAEKIRAAVVAAEPGVGQIGVWLVLLEGSWTQA